MRGSCVKQPMKTKPSYFYPTATAPALLSVCGDVPINEAVSEAANMVGAALDTLKALVNSLPAHLGGHNAQCAIYTLETAAGILTAVQAGLADSTSDAAIAPLSVSIPEPLPAAPAALEFEPEPELESEPEIHAEPDDMASDMTADVAAAEELASEPELESAFTSEPESATAENDAEVAHESAAETEDKDETEAECDAKASESESELESLFSAEPDLEPEPEPEFEPVATADTKADEISDLEAVLLAKSQTIDDFEEDEMDMDFNIPPTPAPAAKTAPAAVSAPTAIEEDAESNEHPWSVIAEMDPNELAKLDVNVEQMQTQTETAASVSPWEDDEADTATAQTPAAATSSTVEPDSGFSSLDDAAQHDPLGLCPICGRNDGYLNISKNHFAVCNKHRVFWHVGTALFDSWQHENETIWQRNKEKLKGYKQVEPIYARHLAQEGEWPRPRAA